MSKKGNQVNLTRFADYFVICGLDYSSGLEAADRFGKNNEQIHSNLKQFKNKEKCKSVKIIFCVGKLLQNKI